MVWLSLDYFKCDPFELNFRIYVLAGFWPLETKERRKQILFSIFSYLCYFSISSFTAIQFLDIYLLLDDMVKLTKDLSIISISFAICVKSYLILYSVDLVNQLKKDLVTYKSTRTDSKDVEILEEANKQTLNIVKTFYGITVPCVIVWIMYPALDSSDEKRVPFPYRLPVDDWTNSVYTTVYTYHSLAMVSYMLNVLSVDLIFCGFVQRINAHYNIIIKNFELLDGLYEEDSEKILIPDLEKEIKTKKLLGHNINLHIKILRQFDIFRKIYKGPSLVHFVGVTVATGALIVDNLIFFTEFKLQMLQRALYLTIAVLDTFLYCFFATVLEEKSYKLADVAYNTKWHLMKPGIRKDLIMFLKKAQRPPKVYVGNIFPLELHTFLNLLKITYDVTAVLYQTTKKN